MVTLELRLNGETIGEFEADPKAIARLLGAEPAARPRHPPRAVVSSPMTAAEAAALIERLDAKLVEFLRRLAAGEGALTWGEARTLFGLRDFQQFSEGPGHDLLEAVRHVLRDRSARLVWRNEHEWEGLSRGRDEACWLHVDGEALKALQAAFAA